MQLCGVNDRGTGGRANCPTQIVGASYTRGKRGRKGVLLWFDCPSIERGKVGIEGTCKENAYEG